MPAPSAERLCEDPLMRCKKCGSEAPEGALFCPRCGTPLSGRAGLKQALPAIISTASLAVACAAIIIALRSPLADHKTSPAAGSASAASAGSASPNAQRSAAKPQPEMAPAIVPKHEGNARAGSAGDATSATEGAPASGTGADPNLFKGSIDKIKDAARLHAFLKEHAGQAVRLDLSYAPNYLNAELADDRNADFIKPTPAALCSWVPVSYNEYGTPSKLDLHCFAGYGYKPSAPSRVDPKLRGDIARMFKSVAETSGIAFDDEWFSDWDNRSMILDFPFFDPAAMKHAGHGLVRGRTTHFFGPALNFSATGQMNLEFKKGDGNATASINGGSLLFLMNKRKLPFDFCRYKDRKTVDIGFFVISDPSERTDCVLNDMAYERLAPESFRVSIPKCPEGASDKCGWTFEAATGGKIAEDQNVHIRGSFRVAPKAKGASLETLEAESPLIEGRVSVTCAWLNCRTRTYPIEQFDLLPDNGDEKAESADAGGKESGSSKAK